MLSAATIASIVALLGNPLVQLGGSLALRGAGYGMDDAHAAIQLRLYRQQTDEILYRAQVVAYAARLTATHQRKVACKCQHSRTH